MFLGFFGERREGYPHYPCVTRASKTACVNLHSVLILKNSISIHLIFLPISEYRQNQMCRSGHCIVSPSPFLFVVDIFAFDLRPSHHEGSSGSAKFNPSEGKGGEKITLILPDDGLDTCHQFLATFYVCSCVKFFYVGQ